MQENRRIFDGIIPNLPMMRCDFMLAEILASVFSMGWYKIVMHRFLVVYHGISHLFAFSRYFLENKSDTWDIQEQQQQQHLFAFSEFAELKGPQLSGG